MMIETYFFDSYAFFEMFEENPHYKRYRTAKVVTTKLNLFEVYLGWIRAGQGIKGEKFLAEYGTHAVDFDLHVIAEAAYLKLVHNKSNISMTDCIGYCVARKLKIKFLTGDKAFEGMKNVEYVK